MKKEILILCYLLLQNLIKIENGFLSIIFIAVIRISCVNDNGYCDYKEEVSAKTDCQSVKNIDEGFVCYTDDDGNDVVKCHAVPKDDGYVDYAEALKDYESFSVHVKVVTSCLGP